MEPKKVKTEIERRTRDTSKLVALEAQKVAVGEMVLERLDEILELLQTAGFKVSAKTVPAEPRAAPVQATAGSIPPNTIVVQAGQLAPGAPAQPVQRPCVVCGQEAVLAETLPDGTQKVYCRPHGQARSREKQEEAVAADLFHGNTGTLYTRPKPTGPPPQKTIIQAPPMPAPAMASNTPADPLKGPFSNGPSLTPPHNPIFDADD